MQKLRLGRCLGLAAVIVALLAPEAPRADAQDVASFYRGRTLDVYASAEPGSGYDGYTRLVARFIGKYIPGHPTTVVQNMVGASGLVEANYLANQAPRDGTAFGIITNNMTVEPLLGNKNARFDPSKFTWLGSADKLVGVCIAWHAVPVRTIADLRDHPWIVGATAETSATVQEANLFIVLGGAKLTIVKGYPSTNSMILALERGEIQIACGIGWDSVKSSTDYLQEGKIVPVMQMGYEKSSELPDVPFIYDMLLDPAMKPELDFITRRQYIGRAFAAPPGVPSDRAEVLRNAFWSALHDPDLIAEARKQRMELGPLTGDEVQTAVAELDATPPSVINLSNKILQNNGAVLNEARLNWIDAKDSQLTGVERGGAKIAFTDGGKTVQAATEGAKVTIAGNAARASDLKPGLTCDISYLGDGDNARTIDCR